MPELTKTKRTGILGIGNLLLSDEGFGIHTVHYLDEHYTFSETVQITERIVAWLRQDGHTIIEKGQEIKKVADNA